jgi:hypothetical protein
VDKIKDKEEEEAPYELPDFIQDSDPGDEA